MRTVSMMSIPVGNQCHGTGGQGFCGRCRRQGRGGMSTAVVAAGVGEEV